MFKFNPLLFIAFLFTIVVPLSAADEKPSLTVAQRKEMQELISEFKRARGQTEQRLAVLDKLAQIGPLAVNGAAEVIAKDIQRALIDYRLQFGRTATQAFVGKVDEKNVQEVLQLRAKVLELGRGENLTKDAIEQISDPALARLKEILLVSREEVFARSAALAKPREALLQQGLEWDHCQLKLREGRAAPPEEAPPANAVNEDEVVIQTEQPVVLFADYLAKEEELAIFAAMPMDNASRQTLLINAQLASKFDPEESRCMQDANLIRSLLGLRVLQFDPQLAAAARDHSADVEKLNFFAHESPVAGKTTPWDRAKLFGTSASAENIAAGVRDGVAASRMWWHSPGHHKNMIGEHGRIGVGRHEARWTQLFGAAVMSVEAGR